jgi:predicted metal-dependent hydrolase
MQNILITVIFIFILLLVCMVIYNNTNKKTIIINGEEFRVYRKYKDRKEAAELLNRSNRNIIKFIEHLKTKPEFKNASDNLKYRYNPGNFEEGIKSYTVSKGEKISMCLRNASGKLYSDNMIMFVLLHEITHVAINSHDHNNEFWETFGKLLKEAYTIGIYQPINYALNPEKYCGIIIKHNPFYD